MMESESGVAQKSKVSRVVRMSPTSPTGPTQSSLSHNLLQRGQTYVLQIEHKLLPRDSDMHVPSILHRGNTQARRFGGIRQLIQLRQLIWFVKCRY